MKLFTKEINDKLFKQYPKGSDLETQVVVSKIFNPYGKGRWFLINSDPSDPDYLWAIVQMGDIVEIGSVSRKQLESLRVSAWKFPLERDLSFSPIKASEVFKGLQMGKHFDEGGEVENENKEMVLNQVEGFEHHAEELEEAVEKADEVPAWVVAKSQRASTDLSDITHYLDGQNEQGREKKEGEEFAKGGYMAKGGEITVKVGDRVKSRKGVDGEVYESTGSMFKLKDNYGGKNPKWYSTRDFKSSEIKKMADGGETEDGVDLFEDYDSIPANVQKVLDKHSSAFEDGDYRDLEKAHKALLKIGYTFEYGLDGEAYDLRKVGQKGKSEEYASGGMMEKGGITGDVHSLTDKLLSQKIQIFIDKVKPIKYYYIDEKSNSLVVGLDENYKQDAADKFYKEATSSMEFFDADSIDMVYMPTTKDTQYVIKLKKPVKFASGGMMDDEGIRLRHKYSFVYEKMLYTFTVELNNSEDELFEFETMEQAFRFAREEEKMGNRITDVSKYKKVGFQRYKKEQELLDKYKEWTPSIVDEIKMNKSIEARLRNNKFADGGMMAKGGEIRYKLKGNNFGQQVENGQKFKLSIAKVFENQSGDTKYPENFIKEIAYTGKIVKSEGSNYLKDYSYKGTLTKFEFLDDKDFLEALKYVDRPSIKSFKFEEGGYMAEGGVTDPMSTVNEIARLSGLRPVAVAEWGDKNNINLSIVLKDLKSKKIKGMDLMTAIVGNPNNKYQKELLAKYSRMASGGMTFEGKVKSIKKSLIERKKVSPKVQNDYGKTYSPKEAEESAKRIVGAMTARERLKMKTKKK